jgi:hypothetical protein
MLLLGCAVICTLDGASMGRQTRSASSANLLCSEGKIICISASVERSLISNPLRIEVRVNSPNPIEVNWEIDDKTGQVLDSSSPSEYIYTPGAETSPEKPLHIQDFIFKPPTSTSGTLVLIPKSYTVATGEWIDLLGLKIPVRLTTAKTMVTTLEPEAPGALQSAVNEWMDEESHSSPEFDPKLKLVAHRVAIMRVDRDANIGATAEAVLRSKHGQQEQWHVRDWRQEANIAHIKISGDGWAGSSSYWTAVQYLIRKSVVHLPGIEKVAF